MIAGGEFALIRRFFAPLAGPGGLELRDDAAVLDIKPGRSLVVTVDAVIAGVHFLPDDPADLVARKALRVNLSDLAAMAAEPLGYLIAAALPGATDEAWLEAFASGLRSDQREFSIVLLGGDTTATTGPLTLAVTALGTVETGRALLRRGARPGDRIHVSGTIGDGAFGLKALRGEAGSVAEGDRQYLIDRYRLPQPRLALGRKLAGLASAAIDVSDGLAADLGHICDASGVGAVVWAERVPLSAPARAVIAAGSGNLAAALTGGDDYELLFTIDPGRAAALKEVCEELRLPVTEIGEVVSAGPVRVIGPGGKELALGPGGYRHF
jgi:thiamine-monophosphate kinase